MIDPAVLRQYAPTWARACSMYAECRAGRSRDCKIELRLLQDAVRRCTRDQCRDTDGNRRTWQLFRHEILASACPYCGQVMQSTEGWSDNGRRPRMDGMVTYSRPKQPHEYTARDFVIDFERWAAGISLLLPAMIMAQQKGPGDNRADRHISLRTVARQCGCSYEYVRRKLDEAISGYDTVNAPNSRPQKPGA